MVRLNPYINFNGEAEEAMNFYKSVFGGELTLSRFGDVQGMPVEDQYKQYIMHADLTASDIRFFASDANAHGGVQVGQNMAMSLSGDYDAKLTEYFEGLAAGGNVTEPLKTAPWGDKFGMLTDKFGINWMVNISAEATAEGTS